MDGPPPGCKYLIRLVRNSFRDSFLYMTASELEIRINELAGMPSNEAPPDIAREAVDEVLAALDQGTVRAASRNKDGAWTTHTWVKRAILLGFRIGILADYSSSPFAFLDKDTYPPRTFDATHGVRIVPGGSTVRTGAHLAPGVVCMPPMYVNTGAYIDENAMIDSHALVGSCAQIGKRVHLSAAAQIGGVLEPVGAVPVIVEDDVFVGGGCGVYEGCLIRAGAVLAPGVVLTGSTRLYDLARENIIGRNEQGILEIPENAVVAPGARAASGNFADQHGLSLYTPVIVKYRDRKTDAAIALEEILR